MTFVQKLTDIGLEVAEDASQRRSIMLSNIISLIIFCLGSCLFAIYYWWYGWNVVTAAIPIITLFSLSTLLLNYLGYSIISRINLSLVLPVSCLAISIYSKSIYYESQEELDYFTFRFFMFVSCILPAIFFSLKERFLLITVSLVAITLLLMHDPLHWYFEVPYRQDVLKESNYYFVNVVVVITYLIMAGAVLFLKVISEESEEKAACLIKELNSVNGRLLDKNKEIEAQNHEITAQTENLNISQQKLHGAYKLIQEQKELLLKQNKTLSGELMEMNNDLTATNNELIKYNNELRQFSYTVSHNLRGPVASLSGLIGLIDSRNLTDEHASIFEHIKTSIQKLESIIKDLSKIIDIRHDIFAIRQRISLQDEVDSILLEFGKEIRKYGIEVIVDVEECPVIYSVKPMVHSILYNLITNAIKYRSPDRRPEIHITARIESNFVVFSIRDNGLGIDLKNYRDSLFKLYKRFHFHTEGKGIGLYLVKLQAEALGGYVEVMSERNVKTQFTVYLAKPENIERQVLYDESHATIYYDARINSTGVVWKGPISSEEYRLVFHKCLEFVKAYNTPNYFSDLRQQGYVAREDQIWMFRTIMPEAQRYGLRRIAGIRPAIADPRLEDYYTGIKAQLLTLGIAQEFFTDYDQAMSWLHEGNEISIKFTADDRKTHNVG